MWLRILISFAEEVGENSGPGSKKSSRMKSSICKEPIALKKEISNVNSTSINALLNSLGDRPVPADQNLTPSSEAVAAEQVERFHAVLSELPEDYAEVIRLRSIERLTFKEVAKRMERSHDSVTKLWYRAMLQFEAKLRGFRDFL